MSFNSEEKAGAVKPYQQSANDTGSPEVQVALLTGRISELSKHFESNPKDLHSKRGMMALISQRKSLLSYLKGKSLSRYHKLITGLGLRK